MKRYEGCANDLFTTFWSREAHNAHWVVVAVDVQKYIFLFLINVSFAYKAMNILFKVSLFESKL